MNWPARAGLLLCLFSSLSCSHFRREAPAGTIIQALDETGHSIALRIDGSEPDPIDVDGELRLYRVSIQVGDGWQPFCLPDVTGLSAAIPVQGSWGWDGVRKEAPQGAFTFACTNGAIGKCMRWGYKPWKSSGGISLDQHHAACVRMVRADYCGDGRHHTVNGTPIDVYDRLGIQKPEAAAEKEELEAAWGPDGATYLRVPRQSDDVDAIVRECPARLAGRTSLDAQLSPEQIVERFPETLMFNNRLRRPR
jgi:hypothetical protein